VKRLVALAQALSADGVWQGALRNVQQELHRILDSYATRYPDKVTAAVKEVWDVNFQELSGRIGEDGVKFGLFVERADDRAIRSEFEAAKKAFGADVAQSYVDHLAGRRTRELMMGCARPTSGRRHWPTSRKYGTRSTSKP
jgi:type III restriction enzyme